MVSVSVLLGHIALVLVSCESECSLTLYASSKTSIFQWLFMLFCLQQLNFSKWYHCILSSLFNEDGSWFWSTSTFSTNEPGCRSKHFQPLQCVLHYRFTVQTMRRVMVLQYVITKQAFSSSNTKKANFKTTMCGVGEGGSSLNILFATGSDGCCEKYGLYFQNHKH